MDLIQIVAVDARTTVTEIVSTLALRNVEITSLTIHRDRDAGRLSLFARFDGDPSDERVHKWLNRIVDVVRVVHVDDAGAHCRSGVLVRVSAGAGRRGALLDLARASGAEVVEETSTTVTLAHQASMADIEHFLAALGAFDVTECVPTGIAAIARSSSAAERRAVSR